MPPAPAGCEVRPTAAKGYGLFATAPQPKGAQILTEEPLFVMQHVGNRRVVGACANCCAFLGSVQEQLEVLFGEQRFAPLMAAIGPFVPQWQAGAGGAAGTRWVCSRGCGEVYCSERCRDAHLRHSHNLLCTGPIEDEGHPLLRFKYFALEHTDTLLLAAQVIAHLVNRATASGGGAAVTKGLMAELMTFCHAPFRDACRPPPGRGKDAAFLAHTDALIAEAASLLHAALQAHAPAEVAALFEAGPGFLSELLGLFEYNSIDVEVNSPLGPLFAHRAQALAAAAGQDARAGAELAAIDRLLREKEWVMRCVWGEETTGIYGEDDDDDGGGALDCGDDEGGAMDTCMDDGESDDDGHDAGLAEAAMAEARREVDAMSLEQLLQARWPSMHGTALFACVSRINHSCVPNVAVEFPRNSALVAVSLAPVAAGDELCISYINLDVDCQARRQKLLGYGFLCSCPRCLAEDSASARRAKKRLK